MTITKKSAILLTALGLIVGIAGSIGLQSYASSVNTTNTTPTDDSITSTATGTPATEQPKTRSHSALGGDGNVTAINGNTITMQEEANEGGAIYTVDASNAAITNNGAQAKITDIKVGDKIFVQGDISGTNVAAKSISLGRTKGFGHATLGNDGNITAINGNTITMQEEANEGGASYTVNASNATITDNGAASNIANLKVGNKIFVQGAVNGNNVVATSISLGHFGEHGYYRK